ncbi:zf-CCHC domain-containing protein/RVP_2 domain-containing protein [Cephalotus follicularis]|uniref:Zf-CCHC domain-containing protein/RVP_2 domain-containing protein n=1 Tax=Cephalotus follicularis TaxID=3775 RepID=A0A1Q3BJ11_CEPFO|nr:zf-CCHC domain-containing protein/RVP_2 domain-containing protein [Cephalotus follicularis]
MWEGSWRKFSTRKGACYKCGKQGHQARECRQGQDQAQIQRPIRCYKCGQEGHMSNQCTRPKTGGRGIGAQQQRAPAMTYAMMADETENPNDVVTGTFPVCSKTAHVLFDTEATHSFMSLSFARCLSTPSQELEIGSAIETPSGNTLVADKVHKSCDLKICDRKMLVNLVPLAILNFDVILGMDWISTNHASVDCFKKEVRFDIPDQPEFIFRSTGVSGPLRIISSMKAKRLLKSDCEGYLPYVVDTK